eukprot:Nk52_evm5s158 gene=Nk52_evmTU5s158
MADKPTEAEAGGGVTDMVLDSGGVSEVAPVSLGAAKEVGKQDTVLEGLQSALGLTTENKPGGGGASEKVSQSTAPSTSGTKNTSPGKRAGGTTKESKTAGASGGGGSGAGAAGGPRRVKGHMIEVPIVFGNVAQYLGKKAEESATHRWTVYVRSGVQGCDLSKIIKKVTFKLHESFSNPTRVIEVPPYELCELGWGEFEIMIKIHFMDPNERPIVMYHTLRLYPNEDTLQITKKVLVCEEYDQIVFNEPTEVMFPLLKACLKGGKLPMYADATEPTLSTGPVRIPGSGGKGSLSSIMAAANTPHAQSATVGSSSEGGVFEGGVLAGIPGQKALMSGHPARDYPAEERKEILKMSTAKIKVAKEMEKYLGLYKELNDEAIRVATKNEQMEEQLKGN